MRTETLIHGDCFQCLSGVTGIVITDPPYGMTDAKWDVAVDVSMIWSLFRSIGNTVVITASQPYTSLLVSGNLKDFKTEWIWEKNAGSNFGTVKFQPMKEHESVLVFCSGKLKYRPIMQERSESGKARVKTVVNYDSQPEAYSGITGTKSSHRPELRYPRSIQKFNRERGLHPNQKPVALIDYFIKTYTDENDIIIDPFMGSGTTGVAAKKAGRSFVGVEKEERYFNIAKKRISET